MSLPQDAFDEARKAAHDCARSVAAARWELGHSWPGADEALDTFQRDALGMFASARIAAARAHNAYGLAVELEGKTSALLDAIKLALPGAENAVAGGRTFSTWHEAAYHLAEHFAMIPALAGDAADGPGSEAILNVPPCCEFTGEPGAEYRRLNVLLSRGGREAQRGFWTSVLELVQELAIDLDRVLAGIDREWAAAVAATVPTHVSEPAADSRAADLSKRQDDPAPIGTDGPGADYDFYWQGKRLPGWQPVPWNLVRYLWPMRNSWVPAAEMTGEVWGDPELSIEGGELRSAASKATRYFLDARFPFAVETKTDRARGLLARLTTDGPPLPADNSPRKQSAKRRPARKKTRRG